MNRTLLLLLLCGCAAAPAVIDRPHDVSFTPLAKDVWRYEVRTNDHGEVLPANGLVIDTADGPVLVDTGWRPDQAEALLTFVEQTLHRQPALVVVTHSHSDRSGGLPIVRQRGLRVAWTGLAAQRYGEQRDGDLIFSEHAPFGSDVELFFPGAGHTPDNIVVWHAPTRTLYGGCFIKALDMDLGWLQEADLDTWPRSLEAVLARYGGVQRVVPGHGAPGGPELISHTLDLLKRPAP